MMSAVARAVGSAGLTPLKATSGIVSNAKVIAPSVSLKKESYALKPTRVNADTPTAFVGHLPTGPVKVCAAIAGSTQVRFSHSEVKVPDFNNVRYSNTVDPNVKSSDTYESRYIASNMITGVYIISGAYLAKGVVRGLMSSLLPSATELAVSQIEINIGDIPEGKSVTFKWRGKPVFIKHRTAEMIEKEAGVDVSSLRDPEHDNVRVKDPKWLVVIGVCTHLGCVPIADAGEYGGYYCPCHGSHYDSSGRVRKGPAPLNLEVPHYEFPEPGLLVIG